MLHLRAFLVLPHRSRLLRWTAAAARLPLHLQDQAAPRHWSCAALWCASESQLAPYHMVAAWLAPSFRCTNEQKQDEALRVPLFAGKPSREESCKKVKSTHFNYLSLQARLGVGRQQRMALAERSAATLAEVAELRAQAASLVSRLQVCAVIPSGWGLCNVKFGAMQSCGANGSNPHLRLCMYHCAGAHCWKSCANMAHTHQCIWQDCRLKIVIRGCDGCSMRCSSSHHKLADTSSVV